MTASPTTDTYEAMKAAWAARDAAAKAEREYHAAAPERAAQTEADECQAREDAYLAEIERIGEHATPAAGEGHRDYFAVPGVAVEGEGYDLVASATVYFRSANGISREVGRVEGSPLALPVARTAAAALANASEYSRSTDDGDGGPLELRDAPDECAWLELAGLGFVCTIRTT